MHSMPLVYAWSLQRRYRIWPLHLCTCSSMHASTGSVKCGSAGGTERLELEFLAMRTAGRPLARPLSMC